MKPVNILPFDKQLGDFSQQIGVKKSWRKQAFHSEWRYLRQQTCWNLSTSHGAYKLGQVAGSSHCTGIFGNNLWCLQWSWTLKTHRLHHRSARPVSKMKTSLFGGCSRPTKQKPVKWWENDGKMMGKWWENDGKIHFLFAHLAFSHHFPIFWFLSIRQWPSWPCHRSWNHPNFPGETSHVPWWKDVKSTNWCPRSDIFDELQTHQSMVPPIEV